MPGDRIPHRADAVLETVGAATFGHSLRAGRHGGTIVVAGGTSGFAPSAELGLLLTREIPVKSLWLGRREDLTLLAQMAARGDFHPVIDSILDLRHARQAFAAMEAGTTFGKLIVRP